MKLVATAMLAVLVTLTAACSTQPTEVATTGTPADPTSTSDGGTATSAAPSPTTAPTAVGDEGAERWPASVPSGDLGREPEGRSRAGLKDSGESVLVSDGIAAVVTVLGTGSAPGEFGPLVTTEVRVDRRLLGRTDLDTFTIGIEYPGYEMVPGRQYLVLVGHPRGDPETFSFVNAGTLFDLTGGGWKMRDADLTITEADVTSLLGDAAVEVAARLAGRQRKVP